MVKLRAFGHDVLHGVIALLCLSRWNISDSLHQAPVVEPVDPGQGHKFDIFEGPPRPAPVNKFRLVETVDCLGERVIIAVVDTSH